MMLSVSFIALLKYTLLKDMHKQKKESIYTSQEQV